MRQAAHPTRTANDAARKRTARGITLLELLVVMLIMLMVTAAAIPIIAPAMKNRQMREATRMVSSYMGAAKARAVQTGRPVGVMIERENGQPYSLQMSEIEVPPPYSGDIIGSKATVADLTTRSPNSDTNLADAGWPYFQWLRVTIPAAEFNHRLIRVGDTIQLGSQGHQYTIFGPDEPAASADGVVDSSTLEVAYVSRTAFAGMVNFPWLSTAPAPQPTTYQVIRQPVRTNTPPMFLPDGIVFDLSVSGGRILPYNTANYSDPTGTLPVPSPLVRFDPQIIFSPSGRIELTTNPTGQLARSTDPVMLLLGRREWMFDVASRGTAQDIVFQNLSQPSPIAAPTERMQPAENFWIVVSGNGQVNTAPVAPNFQDYTDSTGTHPTWHAVAADAIGQSMAFALEQQSQGGR